MLNSSKKKNRATLHWYQNQTATLITEKELRTKGTQDLKNFYGNFKLKHSVELKPKTLNLDETKFWDTMENISFMHRRI